MPVVRMPDGTPVRFPDDMPREQIRDMIASKFPDAAQSVQQSVAGQQNENRSATFEIQLPDGQIYEVDGAIDEQTALRELQTHLAQQQPAPAQQGNAVTGQNGPWEKYQTPTEEGPWQKYAPLEQDGRSLEQKKALALASARLRLQQQGNDGRDSLLGKVDSTVRGAADMLSFGLADEIAAGGDALFNPIFGTGQEGQSFSERYDRNLVQQRATDAADAEDRYLFRLGGQISGGVAGGYGLARNGLSLTGRAIEGGAGLGRIALASGVEGAAMGALQGFGSGEGNFENRWEGAETGAKWGGALGVATPLAVAGVSAGVRRAITPFASSPERQALADTLKREGIELTAGQTTGSDRLRYLESEIGGSTARRITEQQGEQFTAAALRRAGVEASRATPDVIDDAFSRIGQQFDGLANRNRLLPDQRFAADISETIRGYNQLVNESARAPIIMDTATDIAMLSREGISGSTYQALRSRIDRAARASARDPQLQDALYGLRNALDDGMERSIAANNPLDLGAWREARNQYRNMLVIEKAATGAGENTAQGLISPSQLRNATVTGQGRRNYARGKGDFADLARAGEAVMRPLPNSGTAGRLNAQNLGTGILSTLGGIAGTAGGGVPTGILGAAAGAAAPKVIGKALMTKLVQMYLENQQFQQSQMKPATRAIVNALLNIQQAGAVPRLLGQEKRTPLEITVRPNY